MSFFFPKARRRITPLAVQLRDVEVSVDRTGQVRVRQPALFADPDSEHCRQFLRRIFSVEKVAQVCIDPRQGDARIAFPRQEVADADVFRRLGEVFASSDSPLDHRRAVHLHLTRKNGSPVRVYRYQSAITTWRVLHALPGRTRLRHEHLLGRPKAALYIEEELGSTFGVLGAEANYRTGSVLVRFDERVVTVAQLLHIMEGMLHDFDNPPPRSYRHTETGKALTYSSLALAAAADFAFPILLPASGVVLIFTNLGNLRAAWQEIKSRQVGLSVLYITIAGATLASGSFFTAALMGWFIQFWDRRSHRELSAAQRQLLAEFRRRPRFAWLCCDGAELEVPVEQLKKGDTVIVRAGEMIPADGVVIEGHAELDERLVCHTEGLSLKTVNDKVFANSLLFEGDLKIRVQRSSEKSRAATIVRAMEVASTPTPAHLKRRGERFAKRTVAPTLAAAGLGLAVGDLSTALAILRPDYWSGPGMSEPLGKLHDVVECARHGVVVRNPTALERLSQSNLLLIDLHCVLQGFQHSRGVNGNGNSYADGSRRVLNEMREGIEQLRRKGELSVGIISEGSAAHVSRCASFLGADFFESGLSDSAKAELVADRGASGQKVAFVGDCRQHLEAARQAHVAISINDIEGFDEDPADVFLLNSQLSNLSRFWHVSSLERRRRRVHHGYILLPNMVCVAGALFLGFTSLHSVLITNAGVYIVYRSGKKWLRRLQHRSGGSTTIEINNTQAKAGPMPWKPPRAVIDP